MPILSEQALSPDLASSLNPWGAELSIQELIHTREEPLDVPGLGTVSGARRIPFEMTRLGWLSQENSALVADGLRLSGDYINESRLAAAAVSKGVVANVQRKMEGIQWDFPDLIYQASKTPVGDFLIAANIAAEEGHAGQSRQSERHLWYIVHPRALQAIVQLAVRYTTSEETQLVQALCAVHDVAEMGLEESGFVSITKDTVLTPQDLGALAVTYDISPEKCAELVLDYRSLTKLPGPRPERQTSLHRAKMNVMNLTPRAKAAKCADAFDNLHNPKPGQSAKKLEKYTWILRNLPEQLAESGHAELANIARAIREVSPEKARAFYSGERSIYHDMLALLPRA